jgi:hypothetical protein
VINLAEPTDDGASAWVWDDAKTDEYTVFREGAPYEVLIRHLQQTRTDEENREVASSTEARGADFGHECRTITTKRRYRRTALSYRYRVYEAKRTISRRFALGVSCFAASLVGIGFLLGTDLQLIASGLSQYMVAVNGTFTPLGSVALALSGLVAGPAGLSLFIGAGPGYSKGAFKEEREELVTRNWHPDGPEVIEEGEWGPCLS